MKNLIGIPKGVVGVTGCTEYICGWDSFSVRYIKVVSDDINASIYDNALAVLCRGTTKYEN